MIFHGISGPFVTILTAHIFIISQVMRLFRLGRVARALHRFLESSFALLLLMLSFYMIVAHWFACVW